MATSKLHSIVPCTSLFKRWLKVFSFTPILSAIDFCVLPLFSTNSFIGFIFLNFDSTNIYIKIELKKYLYLFIMNINY